MRLALRRVVAGAAAAALGLAGWVACADGLDFGEAQMACCMSPDHDCGAAGMSSDCCSVEKPDAQRGGPIATAAGARAPAGGLAGVLPVVQQPGAVSRSVGHAFALSLLKLPRDPSYLRNSVLLI